MNIFKSFVSSVVVGSVLFINCADLSVQNTNEPTKEAVEGSAENQSKLLAGGFYDLTTAMVSSYATHPDLIADQITSTNNVRNFWDFAQEPRIRLANTTSYGGAISWETFYGGFNSSISTANLFIKSIEVDGNTVTNAEGVDVTDAILAQAYFLRGLARGYLGMFYDQAYLIDENFEIGVDTPEFVPYGQLIDASIDDLDNAISLAEGATAFTFNAMPNPVDSWDADEFIDIVNSYAARILAGEARTAADAASADWTAILNYAENGIGGPDANSSLGVFKNANIGSSGEFANYYFDWSNFLVSCQSSAVSSCSGYLPTDVKVIHSMDPSYPTTYPADQANGTSADLAAASSSDPRLDGYFVYTNNAGFLRSTRNPALYSNYFSGRTYSGNDWWQETNEVVLFTDTETQLLIAEAHLMLNDKPSAATTLNNSAAGTGTTTLGFDLYSEENDIIDDGTLSGGHNMLGTESDEEFQFALMREYAVEVGGFGGVGVNWVFMRRHDMLQEGSMTMFPVPGSELEILGMDIYTFGGVDNAGTAGTASGANNWKDLAASAGLKVSAKSSDKPFTPNNATIDKNRAEANFASKGARNN